MNAADIAIEFPMNMEAQMIDMVQDLFDTGASHVMIKDGKLFKPGTEVKLKSTWATTASGQRIRAEAVGSVRMCRWHFLSHLWYITLRPCHIFADLVNGLDSMGSPLRLASMLSRAYRSIR